ncbi:MAG: hypothetical protein ABSB53_03650 [Nitrososphaerales archaeon]
MKLKTRIKLAFLLPLEPDDLRRLNSSLDVLVKSPAQMRLYKLLAKTPMMAITAIGGWSLRRTLVAYASLFIALFVPLFRLDAVGVFLLNLLLTFGRRFYVDSMMRLHIIRRLRSNPDKVANVEVEPLLALFYFVKGTEKPRSFAKFTWLAGRVAFLKEAIYYPSLACMGLFLAAFSLIIASVWVPGLRGWDGLMVNLADMGVYGIAIGMILLFGINFLGTLLVEGEKPVFVAENELRNIGSNKENPAADKE